MDENKNTQLFMGLCSSLVTQAWMQLGKIKNQIRIRSEITILSGQGILGRASKKVEWYNYESFSNID